MKQFDPGLHRELTALLHGGGIEDAALEAKWILEDAATAEDARRIAQRRAEHEPLQYLLGKWEFYGLPFYVGEGVLIPRADTETLVDAVLSALNGSRGKQILDLCTGSGCIALALAAHLPECRIAGLENSPDALRYAVRNQAALGLQNAQMLAADVLAPETAAQYHSLAAVVSNPPYLTAEDMLHLQQEVTFEPSAALDGGNDGLHFYREITRLWGDALAEDGLLAYEVGIHQAKDVAAILSRSGFGSIACIRDAGGIERVVLGRKRSADGTASAESSGKGSK